MAHSFECISTHPERRKQVEPLYIDSYGAPAETTLHEDAYMEMACIRNHERLQTVPFLPPSAGGWSICDALPGCEGW